MGALFLGAECHVQRPVAHRGLQLAGNHQAQRVTQRLDTHALYRDVTHIRPGLHIGHARQVVCQLRAVVEVKLHATDFRTTLAARSGR